MDFFKKPIFTYIGMFLAVLAMIAGAFWPEYSGILWTVAGALGVGSVAALRTLIDSKGWKTYAIAVIYGGLAALQALGILDAATVQILYAVFAPLLGITLQQALAKSSASVPKVGE